MTPQSPAAVPFATWFGTWSRPPDRPAQVALVLAVALLAVALVPRGPRWLASAVDLSSVADLRRRRRFLTVASFAAAFLSLAYIALYLRGGPRTHEASTYWLQGRALSHGALTWVIPDPTASFRARDLVFRTPDRLSGTLPPGYPLLLALGFLVGAPMLVGPVLAATLVIATWLLAHEVVAGADGTGPGEQSARAEAIARVAAGLSIVSAALRYHTAEALPHGAAAVAVATSLACALRGRRTNDMRFFGVAGLAVGFLVASHPTSALAVGIIVAVLALGAFERSRALAWICAAALPGLLLLLAANHAATGRALVSPAPAQVATALGIGASATPLAVSTLQCARKHLLDIANLEPLALLALVPLVGGVRRRAAVLTALVIGGHLLVRAILRVEAVPAGAEASRLVAVVPLEHVLMALGIARLFPRALVSGAVATLALALAGFAIHASHEHQALALSDLGRPRFEPDVLREANVSHGLVFFDDDTGYKLAYDPGVSASHGVEAARMRGDDHDRLLYDSLGHPPVHHYLATSAGASVSGWTPSNAGSETWRFEAESDWPPLLQVGGWSEVRDSANPCASGGRVLRIVPTAGGEASATLALPLPQGVAPADGRVWTVAPRVLRDGGGGKGALTVVIEPGRAPLAEWTWNDSGDQPTCVDLPPQVIDLRGTSTHAWLVVRAHGGPVMYDKTTIWAR